jgi:hypothetical protein
VEAKEACGIDQLRWSWQSGIEGAIHVWHMWRPINKAEEWDFCSLNGSTNKNRTAMLWTGSDEL